MTSGGFVPTGDTLPEHVSLKQKGGRWALMFVTFYSLVKSHTDVGKMNMWKRALEKHSI